MKKVFIIHGFQGSPNGGWRAWLMDELGKQDIYACSLSMQDPDQPICTEWIAEITRHVEQNPNDEIYLVGHSLGATAILRYLEYSASNISGAVLVSGPIEINKNSKIENFLNKPFDFQTIKSKAKKFVVIHGDNDPHVPSSDAKTIARELDAELIWVPNGGHLNGSAGWVTLPQCSEALTKMMK